MGKVFRLVGDWCRRLKEGRKLRRYSRSNEIGVDSSDLSRIKIRIWGKNNVVRIGKLRKGTGQLEIRIHGDGNKVILEDGLAISEYLKISLGAPAANMGPVQGVKVQIGTHCSFERVSMQTYNSHAVIEVGEHCMFSFGIQIYHTDGHPILDASTRQVINRVKTLSIGNHTWIGANTTIMKNAIIGSDCIVGWGSVVSGKFPASNCILAGNPARVVRQGITWDANGAACGYIANELPEERYTSACPEVSVANVEGRMS